MTSHEFLAERTNGPGRCTTTSLDRPVRTRLLIDEARLQTWVSSAAAGDRLEYFRGCLAVDRLPAGSRLPAEHARELNGVAKAALALSDARRVHLVQRRHGPGDYTYICVARPGRDNGSDQSGMQR